ncbi:Hypothetical_protein [Hexamita inflata]|nr:Hypothetical protein HINF_LOCUS37357 [Hexamita inflata]
MLADTLSPLNFTNMQILIIVSIVTLVQILVPFIVILLETLQIQLKKDILSFLNAPQNRIFLRTRAILSQMPINYYHSLTHRANTERVKSFENNIIHIENSTIQQQVQILTTNDFQLKLISQIQVVNMTSKQKRLTKFTLRAQEAQNLKLSLFIVFQQPTYCQYLQTINNDLVHDLLKLTRPTCLS